MEVHSHSRLRRLCPSSGSNAKGHRLWHLHVPVVYEKGAKVVLAVRHLQKPVPGLSADEEKAALTPSGCRRSLRAGPASSEPR